jgi:hypothetical protein
MVSQVSGYSELSEPAFPSEKGAALFDLPHRLSDPTF